MVKKLRENRKNKKGFTLVELIVVIVIILVLAAVMVPSVTKYVAKANKANCKADAATTLTQLQVNVTDNYTTGTTAYTLPATIGNATLASEDFTDVTAGSVTYFATLDAEGTVTKFSYQNGKYTAFWGPAAGWTGTSTTN